MMHLAKKLTRGKNLHSFSLLQTRVVDRFMKNILKYVEDGMDD
jgi:hypothetical protein